MRQFGVDLRQRLRRLAPALSGSGCTQPVCNSAMEALICSCVGSLTKVGFVGVVGHPGRECPCWSDPALGMSCTSAGICVSSAGRSHSRRAGRAARGVRVEVDDQAGRRGSRRCGRRPSRQSASTPVPSIPSVDGVCSKLSRRSGTAANRLNGTVNPSHGMALPGGPPVPPSNGLPLLPQPSNCAQSPFTGPLGLMMPVS